LLVSNPKREIELADRLHSAAIHVLRRVAREDAASGLGGPALSALSVVVFGGPITVGRLAEAERVRPPTMTRTVQGLEAAGLVRRDPDATDGRMVRISATARGVEVLQAARARRVAALASSFSSLGERDLRTLERAAGLLEHAVSR
jgi:DNA-binding MarR family transcriptional regulator